ncbi:hypothetical protein JCM15519_35770 [Fundidesulfovibrio butyratiphilus]
MNAKFLFERLQCVIDSIFDYQGYDCIRRCETKRIDGEFIRRRAEGALQRSVDGRVVVGVTLQDGFGFAFPTCLGSPYEEFTYLACEGQDLYLADYSLPDVNGHVKFTSRLIPLAKVAHINFAWGEAVQARAAA